MSYSTDLTDAQWAMLEPLLQRTDGPGRPTELDLRTVVNALLYTNRTGCQWRMYAHNRFSAPQQYSILLRRVAAEWHLGAYQR